MQAKNPFTAFESDHKCADQPSLDIINFFMLSSSSMKLIMPINVRIPTIVGISTFISRVSTTSKSLIFKAKSIFIFQHFSFYKLSKCHVHLNGA